MSVPDGNCCSSDQDELDDLHSPTDVSEDSIEVKVRPIPIRNKRKCTEPRHNPQSSHKKLMLDPIACGIGSEQFHPWYPQQQEEPLALVLRADSAHSCIPLGTVKHHGLLSQQLSEETLKQDSDVVICTSVSDNAISSRLSSQSYLHTTLRNGSEESHSPPTLNPNTKKIKYLEVKDSVPHNDSLISISPNQSDHSSTRMFMSFENRFLDSDFVRLPLQRNENIRSHVLLHKTTEASGFSSECSKEMKGMLLHSMVQNQDVDSRLKVHTSLLNKSRKGRQSLNALSNDTSNNTVYPLAMYPKEMDSKDANSVSDQDSSGAMSVRQQALFQVPGGSETSRKPCSSQVEMKSLSVSDCGEDLRKNSVCNFSVESLLGGGEQVLETTGMKGAQRNYKNMTRERRIEANARERTRVHTISAAFDTLRRAIPAYSHNQKLSKLSVLRIACSYILTLSRIAGHDYSADQSQPTLPECIDFVSRTIQTEGKLRRKKDDQ